MTMDGGWPSLAEEYALAGTYTFDRFGCVYGDAQGQSGEFPGPAVHVICDNLSIH